jgi:hypothetical protein
MKGLIFIIALFLSANSWTSEIQLSNQYLKINRQKDIGWQTNLYAKTTLSQKWEAGLLANYLERFHFFEKRLGASAVYRPHDAWVIEARYLHAQEGAELLPTNQYILSLYHSLADGLSPFLTYQNSHYSLTHIQTMRLGVEIEKFKNILLIPQLLLGQAHFHNPRETREVNSFGLKGVYSIEKQYFFSAFAFKGVEASQAIVGRSSDIIETKTAGGGIGHYFFNALKAEALFDYTDLGKLNNQFITTTLNLSWIFQ